MNTFVSILLLWSICTPLSYVLMRKDHLASFLGAGKWTRSDRIIFGGIALLYGPALLIMIGLFGLFKMLSNSNWGRQEVKW